MPDVVVVGAGISGLVCASDLRRAGLDVLVLEAAPRVGGVIRSQRIDGYLVESGPSSILPTPEATAIIHEAGLAGEVVTAPPRSPRYVYVEGRLRKVPFAVLSPGGMFRAAMEPFMPRGDQEEETLASFFTRRFGRQVHDRLAAPFVTGIYAGDTQQLSLEATFPRLAELETRYRSVVIGMMRAPRQEPRSKLSSFKTGMESLPLRLGANLDVCCGVSDLSLHVGLRVAWDSEGTRPKALVLAVPAYVAADLTRPLSAPLADLLARATYAPMVVAAMSVDERHLRRPLDGFGFLIPRSEKLHILGTLFSSSLFPGRAPPGRALLTSFVGGALEPEVSGWSDDRIRDTVRGELRRVLALTTDPEEVAMFRRKRAIPQYRLGHRKWADGVSSLAAQVPGLFLTGSYFDSVSVPGSMERGRRSATDVIEYIRRRP